MTDTIHLTSAELAEVRDILARRLPPNVAVFVFGSRAGGRIKPWSDLDLLLDGDARLSLRVLSDLAEDFDRSRLPWKVDLVDGSSISPEFRRIVDASKLPFDLTPAPD